METININNIDSETMEKLTEIKKKLGKESYNDTIKHIAKEYIEQRE